MFLNSLGLSFTLVFLAETVAISAFLLLTLIAYNFSILGVLWGYCLLGMESVSMLVIETGSQCFGDGGWCGNQVKYELSMVLLLVCYLLVIYLRSYFYYPFHNSYKCLSMTTGVRVFTLFGYAVLLELCCHSIGSDSTKEQAVLVIAVVLYGANREPVWNHPQIRQVWDILITILLWTSLIIYLGPLLRVLSSKQDLPRQHLFWYLLGYSTPVIVLLTYLRGREKEQERQ